MPAITLSRQQGSLGDEIAASLAGRLGWDLIGRNEAIDRFLEDDVRPADRHLLRESPRHFLALSPSGKPFIEKIVQGLRAFLATHSAVLVGFGTQSILSDDPDCLHIRIVAPLPVRVERTRERYPVDAGDAERILALADRRQRRFLSTVFGSDLSDPVLYHMTINTAALTKEEAVGMILGLLEKKRANGNGYGNGNGNGSANVASSFKHPSEAEFARILDMYGIEWAYEPRTFPTEWDAEGNVSQAFRPDFHLTRFGTYIELTTMDQKHVTEKNRKLRRMRELYPDVDVRIVYRKDFRDLLERFRSVEGG